jgi:hypothetical protein
MSLNQVSVKAGQNPGCSQALKHYWWSPAIRYNFEVGDSTRLRENQLGMAELR